MDCLASLTEFIFGYVGPLDAKEEEMKVGLRIGAYTGL
jgi:hypothetical protein